MTHRDGEDGAGPTFGEVVERSLTMLARRGRVSHTALRLEFGLDDATFAALREELVGVLGAAEDDGRVLVAPPAAGAEPEPEPEPEPEAEPEAEPKAPVAGHGAITVLLCDLVRTPELDALGAAARAVVGERFLAICAEPAARLRGHVQPWVAGSVAILFGHPHAQADDPVRAVRCGWEIQRALDAMRAVAEREFGLRPGARLAIATAPAGSEMDAFGDAPRAAGTIAQHAAIDRVTVDAATRAQTHEHFGFEPAPDDHYVLVAPRDASGDSGGSPHRPTPLVGRAGERGLLRALAERAAGGTRTAVLLRGEAGIGKTRLVEALCTTAREDFGMSALRCACTPYHRGSPLHPLLAGLRPDWGPDGADDGLSPQRRRRESLAAVADALAGDGRRLLVVEDLHWADPSTIELLTTLMDGPQDPALMLVLTARSEFVAPASPALQRIELGRLNTGECRRVVELASAEAGLPGDVVAELAIAATGSPLLAEQLTRAALAAQDARDELPATLYGCLMARLDRDSTARAVARLAATIGRAFEVTLLQAAGRIEPSELEWGLERLVAQDIVVPAGPGRYAFAHSLLQDAARSSQRKRALRAHNLDIAQALLDDFPHIAAAEPERVARHLEYAGELARAVGHWRRAGLAALGGHALREAAGHFERAIELNARTPDGPDRRATELSLRILAGRSHALRLGWSAPVAKAHLTRAELLSGAVDDGPQLFDALLGLAAYLGMSGRGDDALELARTRLRAIAIAAGDPAFVLEAECEVGGALVRLGRHREALAPLARALEVYEGSRAGEVARAAAGHERHPAAAALTHRAVALACRGDHEGARYAVTRAIELLPAPRHPYSEASVRCAAATIALLADEREVVRSEAGRALDVASAEGIDDWLGQALALHGWARVQAGEHDAGVAELRRGLALWTATGAVTGHAFPHALLGDALARAGEPELGLGALDEALRWIERGGERWCEPEVHRMRAGVLLALGDATGAQQGARTADSLARRAGATGLERRVAQTLDRASRRQPVA